MHCFDPITSGVGDALQPSMLPWTQGKDSWEMFPKRDKVLRLCIMIFFLLVIEATHGVYLIFFFLVSGPCGTSKYTNVSTEAFVQKSFAETVTLFCQFFLLFT